MSVIFEPEPSGRRDELPHTLMVGAYDEEGDYFEVEHPDACPRESIEVHELSSTKAAATYWHHTCLVQELIDDVGLEWLFVHEDAPPEPGYWHSRTVVGVGQHPIRAWFRSYSADPWSEDYDAGIDLL